MALAPTQLISTPYEDYAGYWLKFYTQGTTTPITMAIDSTGSPTVAKAEISSGGTVPIGFIKTTGDVIFIPYVNEAYDAWLFPTEAEADANDTSSAVQVANDVDFLQDFATSAGVSRTFDTVALMVASTDLTVGDIVYTAGYLSKGDGGDNSYEVVTAGTGTDDGFSFIDLVTHQSKALFSAALYNIKQAGAVGNGSTEDQTKIQAAIQYVFTNAGGRVEVTDQNFGIGDRVQVLASVELAGRHRTGSRFTAVGGLTDWMIELGDRDDATPSGAANFSGVKDLYLVGAATSAGGILVPSEIEHVPGWVAPSRFFELRNLTIQDFSGAGAVAVSIHSHSGNCHNFKINNCARGINIGKAVNGTMFTHMNITGCSEFGIVTFDIDDGSQSKSITFIDTVVQNHAGNSDSFPALLLRNGIAVSFLGLYLENNQTNGAITDVVITGQGMSFKNVFWTNTAAVTTAIGFGVSGDKFSLESCEVLSNGKYLVKMTGTTIKNATIKNIFVKDFTNVQAIHHDSTSNGGVRIDTNNGENLLRNSSFQVAQAGTSFSDPADQSFVLDVFQWRKVTPSSAVVDIARSTTTPSAYYPFSMELDITAAGTTDGARRLNVNQKVDAVPLQGSVVSFAVMLRGSATLNFSAARISITDGTTTKVRAITQLTTTWETFWIPLEVGITATEVTIALELDTGGGTIPVGKVYMVQPQLNPGSDQACFCVRSVAAETAKVLEIYERIDVNSRKTLCLAQNDLTTEAQGEMYYAEKESTPTITFAGTWELRANGANNATGNTPGAFDIAKDRAKVVLGGLTVTVGQASLIRGDNSGSGNHVDIDSRL